MIKSYQYGVFSLTPCMQCKYNQRKKFLLVRLVFLREVICQLEDLHIAQYLVWIFTSLHVYTLTICNSHFLSSFDWLRGT